MTVLGERIGSQGRCAVCLEDGILASQPSPLGEGAGDYGMKDRRSHSGKRGAFVLLAKASECRLFLLGDARKWYSSHGLPVITTI